MAELKMHLIKTVKGGKEKSTLLHLEAPEFSLHYEIRIRTNFFPLFGLDVVMRAKFLARLMVKIVAVYFSHGLISEWVNYGKIHIKKVLTW